jgi:type IV pilus assembly protein PilA
MSEPSDLLAHTRPLADPLRVITIVSVVSAFFLGLVTWPASGIFAGLGIACSTLSFALLIAPPGRPNAIYLRAFKTDKSTATLRTRLAAILGTDFRLSGIRPPKEKSSPFLRFLLPGIVAMRYAGSKFMELEAGDDWMARLWRTYQKTRIVFIDIREVTPHVHEEIEMTLQTVGPERCIFLINRDKPETEWRQLLTEIVGPENDPSHLQLLDVSPDRLSSRLIEADLKGLVAKLPLGVPGESDRGRQFVLDHVSVEAIEKSRHPSAMTVIGIVAALAISTGFGLAWSFISHENIFILLGLGCAVAFILMLWGSSVIRVIARAIGLGRAGHKGAAVRAWIALLIVLLLFVGGPALNAVQTLWGPDAPLVRSRQMAYEVSAIQTLRTLNTAEIMYSSTYPTGFACSIAALGGNPNAGPASPQAAQLITDDLAGGKKYGYTFNISNCTKTKVDGKDSYTGYRITAVPNVAGRNGSRGFCTDESGVLGADPNGGSNCSIQIQ